MGQCLRSNSVGCNVIIARIRNTRNHLEGFSKRVVNILLKTFLVLATFQHLSTRNSNRLLQEIPWETLNLIVPFSKDQALLLNISTFG